MARAELTRGQDTEALSEWLAARRARRIVEDLDPDDRVRLLDDLPAMVANRLL